MKPPYVLFTIIIHNFSRLVKKIRGKAEKIFFPLVRGENIVEILVKL